MQSDPTLFLIYRANIAQELKFMHEVQKRDKKDIQSLVRSAIAFHSIAVEEKMLNSIIREGKSLLSKKQYPEALKFFNEAYNLEKWNKLYGGTIFTNLAYCLA